MTTINHSQEAIDLARKYAAEVGAQSFTPIKSKPGVPQEVFLFTLPQLVELCDRCYVEQMKANS